MKKLISKFKVIHLFVSFIILILLSTNVSADLTSFNSKLTAFKNERYAHGSTYQDNPNLTGGYTCFGFANEVALYIWGSYPTKSMSAASVNSGWRVTYGGSAVDNLCVGDIVRYHYHSIFITGISGDTIYYCQANTPSGTNKVTYDNTVSRSNLKSKVSDQLTSPGTTKTGWVAHYTNGLSPSTPSAPATLGAPTITSITPESTSSILLKWNAVSGASYYDIYRRKSGDADYSLIVNNTISTSMTDTGLESGTMYYYRVFAQNSTTTSERSETAGVFTQCESPSITSAVANNTSSITIKWNKVTGAASYRIDRRAQSDDSYTTIVTGYTQNRTYVDTGLNAGTKYYYRVYAANANSISLKPDGYGVYTQCESPSITSAVATSTSSIKIKWNYVTGAASYRIDRRKQTDDVYTTIVTGYTQNRTYVDTGLEAGSKYYYRVYASNENSISAKPDGYGAYTQCEIPTITSVTANSPSSITIKWNGVIGASSYRIDRRKQVDEEYSTIITDYTSESYTDTNLESGTKYYYRIYAVTEGSISDKPDGEGTFTKFVYSIKYNANGGSGAPSLQSKIQDSPLSLSLDKPTRTGYTFKNWNTNADGSGTSYNAGSSFYLNADTTLYAQWLPITTTSSFSIYKSGNKYTVNINTDKSYPIIVAAYSNQNLSFSKVIPISSTGISFTSQNKINYIKIFYWDINSLSPISTSETISSNEFIIE